MLFRSELWIDIFPFDNVPDRGTRSYCQRVRLMQKLYQKNLEANGFYALEATRKKGIYNYLNKIAVWIAGKFNKEKLVAMAEYVEDYKDINCYLIHSDDLNAYRVYVKYNMKLKNINTLAPCLSAFYIKIGRAHV